MTFRAVLFEQNCPRSDCVRIVLQWIGAVPRFGGRLLQFRIDRWIWSGRRTLVWFLWMLVPREHDGYRKT